MKRIRKHVLVAALPIALLLAAPAALAAPTVTISSPMSGAAVGDSLPVQATVTSVYALTNVHAQVQAPGVDLTAQGSTYAGTLDLTSVAIGPITLTVTATDATSATGSGSIPLVHDHPPAVTIGTTDGIVARPQIRLQATCADADVYGCATLSASVHGGAVLATVNGATLDQTISLASYEGQNLTIDFTATDAAGMKATKSIQAFVDTSSTLIEVARGDGYIVDFDDTRVLFTTGSTLVIRPRAGGADTVIPNVAIADAFRAGAAFLTPLGAIWSGGELRNGATLANNARLLSVSGGYAAWNSGVEGAASAWYRDILADTTTQIMSGVYDVGVDVAANGDAILSVATSSPTASMAVYRYRAGALTQVSPTGGIWYSGGITDGINLAYTNHFSGFSSSTVYLNGVEITSAAARALSNGPGAEYSLAGGWTAFVDYAGGTRVVYTLSPTGTKGLASVFNADTQIDGLSDAGDVMYLVNKSRYLGRAGGGVPDTITAHTLGKSVSTSQGWFIAMGASLFQVVPGGADAGAPDGGSASDAASGGDSSVAPDGSSSGGTDAGSVSPDADVGTQTDGAPPEGGPGNAGGTGNTGGCAASGAGSASATPLPCLFVLGAMFLRRRRLRRPRDARWFGGTASSR